MAPKEHVRVAVDIDSGGSDGENNDAAADGDADEAASDDGADHVAPARRYPTRQRRPPGDWWAGQQALQAPPAENLERGRARAAKALSQEPLTAAQPPPPVLAQPSTAFSRTCGGFFMPS